MGFRTKSWTLAPVSVVQLLICPVARFSCKRTRGLCEGGDLAGRALFLRDPARFILKQCWHFQPATALKGFSSHLSVLALFSETKQIPITTEGADTPCAATSETRPINLKLPPLSVPTAPLMTMLQKEKKLLFPSL